MKDATRYQTADRQELASLYNLLLRGVSPADLLDSYLRMRDFARRIQLLEPAALYLRVMHEDGSVEVLNREFGVLHRVDLDYDEAVDGPGSLSDLLTDPEFEELMRSGVLARGVRVTRLPLNVADRTPLLDLSRAAEPYVAHVVLHGEDPDLLSAVLRDASWPGEVTYNRDHPILGFVFRAGSGEPLMALGIDKRGYPAGAVLTTGGSAPNGVISYRDWVHPVEILRDLRNSCR